MKLCEKYFYWSVIIIFNGDGKVIWVKFKLFLSYIVNKYFGFEDLKFNKCVYGEIFDRKWLDLGIVMFW